MATLTSLPTYDCIIVGGGYAGLAAAKSLKNSCHQSQTSPNILLLEARSRVGGRVMTETFGDGTYFDYGASYLGIGQSRMYALAKEYGVETHSGHHPGRNVQMYRGKHASYEGQNLALGILELIDFHLVMRRFQKSAEEVDLEEPWKTPGALRLDNLTLAEWLNQHCWTTAATDHMAMIAGLIWGARPSEFSALHALWYAKAGGSLSALITSKNGAQHEFVVRGAQTIANEIHTELGEESVHLGEPVISVDQSGVDGDENGVVTVTTTKSSYKTRQVIIAIPPAQVLSISFNPPLPHARQTLLQHSPMGSYWKYFACYKTAFWREKGFCGEAISPDGLVSATFDLSPKHEKYAVLMMFVAGEKARTPSSKSKVEREEAILQELADFYGE